MASQHGVAYLPAAGKVPAFPWLEYVILLAVAGAGYEMKKPFGMLLYRIMGKPITTVHSFSSLAGNELFQTMIVVILAAFVHHRTGLPAAPSLERALYGAHRERKIRIWIPGILGGVVCLLLGGIGFAVAAHFGVSSPLGMQLNMSSLSGAMARKLALLYPAVVLGAASSEEMLFRFGLLTILAWLIGAALPKRAGYKVLVFWLPIVLQALVFGWVHVSQGLVQLAAGGVALQVVISPQTWAGVIFGYLYCRYGLEAGMVAHATTDLVGLIPFLTAALKHAHS